MCYYRPADRASEATPKYFDRLKRASLSTWFVALALG
jgi:hypothetical protein